MKFISILLLLKVWLTHSSVNTDACYAPPLTYGGACVSSVGLVSVCCSYIDYNIDVIGDVNVFCQGLGTGYYGTGNNCTFGWFDLGLVNTGPARLGWSSSAGSPAIKCYGSPTGSVLEWSWTTGYGNIYCPLYCNFDSSMCGTQCVCNSYGNNQTKIKDRNSQCISAMAKK